MQFPRMLKPWVRTIALSALGYFAFCHHQAAATDAVAQDDDHEKEEELAPDTEIILLETQSIAGKRDVRSTGGPPVGGVNTRERAERSGETWRDLTRDTPGVRTRAISAAPERPIVRGFDGDRILILEDGQRMGDVSQTAADHAVAVDPLSVSSVEVVRGGASVLYGGSALGGVVNLRRASLLDWWPVGPELSLRAAGNTADRGFGGHARGAWGGDHLAAAVRGSYRAAGDLRTAEGRLPDTDSRAVEVGSDAGWRAGRSTGELRFSWRDHSYGIPEAWDEEDEFVKLEMNRLRFSHEVITSGRDVLEQVRHSASITMYDHREFEYALDSGGRIDDVDLELAFDVLSHAQRLEVELNHGDGPWGSSLLGIDAEHARTEVGGDEALTPNSKRTRVGLFGLQTLEASPHIEFPIGLRGETTFVSTDENARFSALPSRTFTDIAASAAMVVSPTPALRVGVQASRAFRVPIVEELYSDAAHLAAGAYEIGDADLGSEKTLGGDVWLEWENGIVSMEAATFVARIDDFVVREDTGETDEASGLPIFEYRATSANLFGAEAGVAVGLPHNVEIRAGGDWVRGAEDGFSGAPLPSIPPLQGNLRLGWSPHQTFVRVDSTLTAPQRRTGEFEGGTDGHVLFGAEFGQRFRIGGGYFTSVLRLDNALDAAWRDHLTQVERRGAPNAGRSLSLSMSGEW